MPTPRRTLMRMLVGTLGALSAALPHPSSAQIGIESVLSSINDISFSFSCWATESDFLRERASCPSDRNGWGVEVIWSLTSVPLGRDPRTRAEARLDTLWEVSGKEETYGRGGWSDSTRTYTRKVKPRREDPRPRLFLELGLGYGQFTGFESSDPAFEIRGTVREAPAVTVYGTLQDDRLPSFVKPYVGVKTGLIHLHNVQLFAPTATDTMAVYSGGAQAFQLGALGGVALGLQPFHIFFEYAHHIRRLPSVQWVTGSGRVPAHFPRELDFTGPTFSFGLQVHIRDRP